MRLFLCEKPSQAKDIASVLGATQRQDGYLSGIGQVVTWCVGHLLEAAPPESYGEKYKKWSLEQLPIIPSPWKMEIKPQTKKQFGVVKKLLLKATEVVIATDADREGEMIAQEMLDYCGYKGKVLRLWLSALNEASIRDALGKLKPGAETYSMYHSALARSRADWLIGMNLSRLFTLLGQKSGYGGVLSVGRVQTPTLSLVVRRDREIEKFVPKPYWAIDVDLIHEGVHFMAGWVPPEDATDEAGRCIMTTVAKTAEQYLKQAKTANTVKVEVERLREVQPLPFDLGTLQEVCSRKFGLGAQETLDIAQSLYETHKATTYPRSDSGYLPMSMLEEASKVLAALIKTDPSIKPIVDKLDLSIKTRTWNDKKVTAHHGIIPTLEATNLSKMNEKELVVYQLIRAHYLAQFMKPYEFDKMTTEFLCENQTLRSVGKQVVITGWRSLFQPSKDEEENEDALKTLPFLRKGHVCKVAGTELKALKTLAPRPYTEGELIKAMKGIARFVSDPRLKQKLKETTGIGTEATRAGIIKSLLQRGYIMNKGRSVKATDAAFTLIDAVPPAIADPGMTALWEQALEGIEKGQMSMEEFVSKQTLWVSQLVGEYLYKQILIPSSPVEKCPVCSLPMRRRSGKNGAFWSCSNYPECKETLNIAPSKPTRRKSTGKRP